MNDTLGCVRAVFERWQRAVVDEEEGLCGAEGEGAPEAAIEAFQRRHGVVLPASFRQLYRLSDGTAVMDGHEQIFWPLGAITRTLDSFDAGDPDAVWVGFADFRLQTEVFYLRADRGTGEATVWIDRGPPGKPLVAKVVKLADSFDAYLERYVEDPLFWRARQTSSTGKKAKKTKTTNKTKKTKKTKPLPKAQRQSRAKPRS
jgi:hypothetical protein